MLATSYVLLVMDRSAYGSRFEFSQMLIFKRIDRQLTAPTHAKERGLRAAEQIDLKKTM
jgi:hypothetical protein